MRLSRIRITRARRAWLFPLTLILSLTLFESGAVAQELQSVTRASLDSAAVEGENESYDPRLSADGRYVAFASSADNFPAAGALLGSFQEHPYVKDLVTGELSQLDITPGGTTGDPAFDFLPDLRTFGSGVSPALSSDGRFALFVSTARNLLSSGPIGPGFRAFIRDRLLNDTLVVPLTTESDPFYTEAPLEFVMSQDGAVVVFSSIIINLATEATQIKLFLFDRALNTTTELPIGLSGDLSKPSVSNDGRYIVFHQELGSLIYYPYLYDRFAASLTSVSDGAEGEEPVISGDGSIVAYTEAGSSGINIYDRTTGAISSATRGIDGVKQIAFSAFPSISQDGRYIAFLSFASNLVRQDRNGADDIFVHDRLSGGNVLLSVQSPCDAYDSEEVFRTAPPRISADGQTIAFASLDKLVPANVVDGSGNIIEPRDSNSFDDVYVAVVDYAALPTEFSRKATPRAPIASVNCTGTDAALELPRLVKKLAANLVINKSAATSGRLTKRVVIQRDNNGSLSTVSVKRRIKRDRITVAGLAPGTYVAKVRGEASTRTSVTRTRYSGSTRFVIER